MLPSLRHFEHPPGGVYEALLQGEGYSGWVCLVYQGLPTVYRASSTSLSLCIGKRSVNDPKYSAIGPVRSDKVFA